MSWVGEGAEGAEGADRPAPVHPEFERADRVDEETGEHHVRISAGGDGSVTSDPRTYAGCAETASPASSTQSANSATISPIRAGLAGGPVPRCEWREWHHPSRAAPGAAAGPARSGPGARPGHSQLSGASASPDGRVEAGRVSSRLASTCLTPSCHRPVSVFAGEPLVLVDVLDQRVPHEVGHRLAPPRRDALRRIPQLVVDSDGVLGGRSRVPPHALGHVLTVDTASALPQPWPCAVHALTMLPNAPHGGSPRPGRTPPRPSCSRYSPTSRTNSTTSPNTASWRPCGYTTPCQSGVVVEQPAAEGDRLGGLQGVGVGGEPQLSPSEVLAEIMLTAYRALVEATTGVGRPVPRQCRSGNPSKSRPYRRPRW